MGFVSKTIGTKIEISNEKIADPLGYYRVNTSKKAFVEVEVQTFSALYGSGPATTTKKEITLREAKVYTLPDSSSRQIFTLQPWQCVPIVEERKDWFKIQLDDGIRGFVIKEHGIRTLRKDSLPLPQSPDNKSGASVLSGIATVAGLIVLGTIIGGVREGG